MVRLRSTHTVPPRPARALVCGAVLAATLISARDASAQSVTILASGITRSVSNRQADQQRLWISRDDCLADDVYTFPASVSGFTSGITLEIWVSEGSVDCSQLTNRSGATQQCWNVGSFTPTNTVTPSLTVKARDIVGKHKAGGGPNSGTVADCTVTGGTDAALPLTVFFIVSRGTEALATTPYTGIQYDLQGPPSVGSVTAGIGENALVLGWVSPNSTDVTGYNFYCDPPLSEITGTAPTNLPKTCEPTASAGSGKAGTGGSTSGTGGGSGTTLIASGAGGSAGTSTAGGTSAGASGAANAGGESGSAGFEGGGSGGASGSGGESGATGAGGEASGGASGNGGAGGVQNAPDFGGASGQSSASGTAGTTTASAGTTAATAGTGGTSGTSGAAGATTSLPACATSTCPSKVLVGGQVPDPRYFCGSVRGLQQTSNLIEGLPNGQIMKIGIAAFDTVGNVGPLSPLVCAAPMPIDDFYRAYRDAGGRAGGGYCSVDTVGRASGLAPLCLGLALSLARVLRRRSR